MSAWNKLMGNFITAGHQNKKYQRSRTAIVKHNILVFYVKKNSEI